MTKIKLRCGKRFLTRISCPPDFPLSTTREPPDIRFVFHDVRAAEEALFPRFPAGVSTPPRWVDKNR